MEMCYFFALADNSLVPTKYKIKFKKFKIFSMDHKISTFIST